MTPKPGTMSSDPEPEDEAMAGFFRRRGADPSAMPPCPAPELVQASRMGVLPPDLQARVSLHLDGCVVCQSLAEALDAGAAESLTIEERERVLRRVRNTIENPKPAVTRRWQFAGAAAALALVTFGVLLIRQPRTAPLGDTPTVFQLEKAAIPAQAGTDFVWRGSADADATDDLNRALESYRRNDFEDASRQLRVLVKRYPQSPAGHFYLGVTELFLANDADAVIALENAERLSTGESDRAPEAAWYLAVAYRRSGQGPRATGKLDALCRGGSARAAQACAALAEMKK